MDKRLYRSIDNKVVSGVCGGLGEYFDVDPTLVRIITVLLFFATHAFGLLAYVAAWIIIPKREEGAEVIPSERQFSSWNKYLPGLILIGIGALLLMWENWYWLDLEEFWPAILIVVGLLLIFRRRRKPRIDDPVSAAGNNSNLENGGTVS